MIVLGDLERDPLAHWADIEAGGSRLIVVEGVTVMPGSPRHDDPLKEWPIVKPFPDLVAATEPCVTCSGSGEVLIDSMSMLGIPGGWCPDRCPDCIDGRPKVKVWTECQHPPEADFMGYACDACGAYNGSGGTVLLGHVTVEAVLPIVSGAAPGLADISCLVVYPESRILRRRSPQSHPPFLDHELTHYDPERIVGRFGVLIAAVRP